jgi:hypothetical protein
MIAEELISLIERQVAELKEARDLHTRSRVALSIASNAVMLATAALSAQCHFTDDNGNLCGGDVVIKMTNSGVKYECAQNPSHSYTLT